MDEVRLDFIDLDDFGVIDAFLKDSHELVLVMVIVTHHFALNCPQERQDREVDDGNEDENYDDVGLVGGHKADSRHQNYQVFVNG